MTGCSAFGCENSSKKGFLMKRFPKDTKRRKEWTIKVKRKNWHPTDNSYLCEVKIRVWDIFYSCRIRINAY